MYESVDYYQLTSLLSDEEKLIQKTTRQFVEEKFGVGGCYGAWITER